MTSLWIAPAGECLHDVEPVGCIHPQQLQHHEPDRPTLGCGARFGAFPQFGIDAAQRVAHHGWIVWRTTRARSTDATRRLSIDCVDCAEVAR